MSKCKRLFLFSRNITNRQFCTFCEDFNINSFQNLFSACVNKVQITKNQPDHDDFNNYEDNYDYADYDYDDDNDYDDYDDYKDY